jgi:hypothetical protein
MQNNTALLPQLPHHDAGRRFQRYELHAEKTINAKRKTVIWLCLKVAVILQPNYKINNYGGWICIACNHTKKC